MTFLLLSHRGACHQAPENTLAAFRLGLATGCHGSECDVQVSRDGELVVFHDDTLARLTSATAAVPTLTAAELIALTVRGAGTHPAHDVTIPRLDDVWALHRAQRRPLFVEVKYTSETHAPRARLREALTRWITRQQPDASCTFISFDERLLEALKIAHPSLRTGYIVNDAARLARHQAACTRWADVVLLRTDCITAPLVAWARNAQRPLYAWVADDETTMDRLRDIGVDGLLTNEPATLIAWAQRAGLASSP